MSKRNHFIWKAIQVICWVIFFGYCIQAGTLLFNYVFSLFKPIATHNLHLGLDLSELYQTNLNLYTVVFVLIIGISLIKAYTFFILLQLFKSLHFVKPFTTQISLIITKITYWTFAIGLISVIAQKWMQLLLEKGYPMGLAERYCEGGTGYLAMTAILFSISLIYKRGIAMQEENDLTV